MTSDAAEVTLRGTVERVFFCNPETPAMAGTLRGDGGERVKFAGKLAAEIGDKVELVGTWTTHKKFGLQLDVSSFRVQMDESPDALAALLAKDDRFVGLGPVRAHRVVEAATRISLASDGKRSLSDVLTQDTDEVARRASVPVDVVRNAAAVWGEKRSHFEALARLTEQGWSGAQAQAIMHVVGEHADAVVRRDPYSLIGRIPKFGFRTVDAVALKMGVSLSDPARLLTGVVYCLRRIADDGHVWTTRSGLVDASVQELRPDTLDGRDRIAASVDELVAQRIVIVEDVSGCEVVADAGVAEDEFRVFARLVGGLRDPSTCVAGKLLNSDGHGDLPKAVNMDGPRAVAVAATLNAGQERALLGFAMFPVSVIAGGAGVGKTYLMRAVCEIAEESGLRVALCAPTGKAAKKLSRSTGRQASTIHRLLEPQFDENTGAFRFTRWRENPIEADLLVVDESTMVDVRLMRALLDATERKTRILLVGDHNQIPSVGPGAILRDVLSAQERFPGAIHILHEVVRQAGTLERNTRAILDGLVVRKPDPAWRLDLCERADEHGGEVACAALAESLAKELDLEFAWDVQVLAPKREGPMGTYALNAHLQRLRQRMLGAPEPDPVEPNKPPKPLLGDRVIWTFNDYSLGLFNGTQALVHELRKGGDVVLLTEDGDYVEVPSGKRKNIEVAYALTIHKAQGSEWPAVILAISSSHFYMRDRNLLYTGVSRASRVLALVGDARGVGAFASSRKSTNRQTFGKFIVSGWQPRGREVAQ